jgi:GT2 family glycosyltransferase
MTEVSIVVCTRDRSSRLAACFASIEAACLLAAPAVCELIVVDNASRDATQDVARLWAATASISVTVLCERRGGVSKAKNTGIAASRGRIIVLVDDDCRMDKHYIRDLLAHDRMDTGPVLRGGRVELGDPTDQAYTVKMHRKKERYTGEFFPGGIVIGCNLTMRRDLFARLGSFDERFGPGSIFLASEDNDYILRAYLAGIPVEYVPDMVIYHFHGRKSREDILGLYKTYQFSNGALYAKHVFSHPQVLKWIKWDLQNWYRELRGGDAADTRYGFSYTLKNKLAMRGMAKFYMHFLQTKALWLAKRFARTGALAGSSR